MINSGFFSNMVNGGDRGHGLSSYQSRGSQSEVGNSFVEMEERGYTNLRRNMNEEFILIPESSNKVPMPNMEMTGFINHIQILRTDSEELFKSWITSEESHNLNSSSLLQRTPQGVGRMARDLNYVTTVDDENSTNLNQDSFRNVVERGVQASDSLLEKAWFHGTQPMTRSRSSDLRVLQAVEGGQNMATTCESSIQVVNGRNKENATRARAMDYMTITDDQKPKETLLRCGSVSSTDPMDEGDATKKRRVERSRKMAEAKERILTPTVPSDMLSIVKRCENLEKEVRSLKLNLAFMNRKDSEQTKQLEELQILHGELTEEKERLLEEIERILVTRRKM